MPSFVCPSEKTRVSSGVTAAAADIGIMKIGTVNAEWAMAR